MDSLVEHLVQKESRDKLEQLVPEKLELIQSIIEIKEPQRKLKEQDRHKWICINWNLDRADLQKLRKIRDSLCGQKISLDKLIKRHNATTTEKMRNHPKSKRCQINLKPWSTPNQKPQRTRNGASDDGKQNHPRTHPATYPPVALSSGTKHSEPLTDHPSLIPIWNSKRHQHFSTIRTMQKNSPLKSHGPTHKSDESPTS
jgi:hypothetical protein